MTVQLPTAAVQAATGCSVKEAAARLGLSEKTVRRRIKAGELAASRHATAQGYEWRVHLSGTADHVPGHDADQVPPQPDQAPARAADQVDGVDGSNDQLPGQDGQAAGRVMTTSPPPVGEQALLKALELTDRLQRENMELAGRVGFLQAKLQAAEERLLALSAPPVDAGDGTEDAPPPRAGPWWRFWGWFGGG